MICAASRLCRATTAGVLLAGAFLRAEDIPVVSWQGQTMGSVYSVKIAGTNLSSDQLDSLRLAIDGRLIEVNRQMSHYIPESELSRFNASSSTNPWPVPADFARVTRFSLALWRDSGGAFDPTLSPLINLWGFGEAGSKRQSPADADLARARALTGGGRLSVTESGALQKEIPALQVNLSAVAKGFGVDCMADVLRGRGLSNFLVQISGETFAGGVKAPGAPWRIGVDTPEPGLAPGERMEAVVSLSDRAFSTSGDYRKYFVDAQGRRQCHILDPSTGRPVQHALGSVSVLAPDGMTADALSTTLFVMGLERGLPWINQRTNAAALFIEREPDGRFKLVPSARFPAFQPAQ